MQIKFSAQLSREKLSRNYKAAKLDNNFSKNCYRQLEQKYLTKFFLWGRPARAGDMS
jgi:hypothetical protein